MQWPELDLSAQSYSNMNDLLLFLARAGALEGPLVTFIIIS